MSAAEDILELGLQLPDLKLTDDERKVIETAISFLEKKIGEKHEESLQREKEEARKEKEEKSTDAAQKFVSEKIKKLRDEGFSEDRAIAAALSMAREEGFKIPVQKEESSLDDAKRIYEQYFRHEKPGLRSHKEEEEELLEKEEYRMQVPPRSGFSTGGGSPVPTIDELKERGFSEEEIRGILNRELQQLPKKEEYYFRSPSPTVFELQQRGFSDEEIKNILNRELGHPAKSADVWSEAKKSFKKVWGTGQDGCSACIKSLKAKGITEAESLCSWLASFGGN